MKGTPQAPRSTSKSVLRKHSRSGSPMRDRPGSARSVVPPEDKRSGSPMRDHPGSVRSVVPPEAKQNVPRLSIDVTKVTTVCNSQNFNYVKVILDMIVGPTFVF